jgi:chaperone BCS1
MDVIKIIWLSYLLPILQTIINEVKRYLYERLYRTIVVQQNAPAFSWIKSYMASSALNINTVHLSSTSSVSENVLQNAKSGSYTIPEGKYYIRFNKSLYTIWFTKESLWISTFAIWHSFNNILEFINECETQFKKKFTTGIAVYSVDGSYTSSWGYQKLVFPRSIASIILPNETKQLLFGKLDEFFTAKSKQLYKRTGIPYRKGVLLHGYPGTGKSTVVKTICSKYELTGMYILDLSNDKSLDIISKVPNNSMILIEDVDRYFRPVRNNTNSNEIVAWEPTFNMNKMLNVLDGVASPETCLIVMTANNTNVIPEVMLRPGRVDLVVKFDFCKRQQIEDYTKLFYPDCNNMIPGKIAKALKGKKTVTISMLQRHFMMHQTNPTKALDTIDQIHTHT